MPEIPADFFIHLEKMTDDTGLMEHAIGNIPRRAEGYTTDDNARALWTVAGWYSHLDKQKKAPAALLRLADIYLGFLVWAQQADGHFYNNYAYDRSKEPEQPSEDCLGRTLWSCAEAWRLLHGADRKHVLSTLLRSGFAAARELTYPRGMAFTLAAACSLLRSADAGPDQVFRSFIYKEMPEVIDQAESRLIDLYRAQTDRSWHWFEPSLTYGNGVLPWALLQAQAFTENREARRIAAESLDFLIERMTAPEGYLRPIGNRGWCTRTTRAMWDQQPVEIMALALAAEAAAGQADSPERDLEVIEKCRAWFRGENDGHRLMVSNEGGGYDGLLEDGVNCNQGAESTIAWLMTELIYSRNLPDIEEKQKTAGQTA